MGAAGLRRQGARAEEVAGAGQRHLVDRRREASWSSRRSSSPSEMPPHADWIKVQMQYVPGPKDVARAVVSAHRGRRAHVDDAQAIPHHGALERLPLIRAMLVRVAFRGTKRFELIRKLGEGGEGLVYEAHDNERDMRVALKTLRELDATSLYRFKKEFRALTDVSHPNIVGLYDLVSESATTGSSRWSWSRASTSSRTCGRRGGARRRRRRRSARRRPCTKACSSAAAAGRRRQDARRARSTEQPRVPMSTLVDEARLRSALGQLAQALHALHGAGMVHRDLKPSNVRVTPQGARRARRLRHRRRGVGARRPGRGHRLGHAGVHGARAGGERAADGGGRLVQLRRAPLSRAHRAAAVFRHARARARGQAERGRGAAVGADRGRAGGSRRSCAWRCCRGGRPIARRGPRCWRGSASSPTTRRSPAARARARRSSGGTTELAALHAAYADGGERRDGERVRARRRAAWARARWCAASSSSSTPIRAGRSCSRGAVTSARACRTKRSTTSSIA